MIILDNLFWKDEEHKEDFEKALGKLGRDMEDNYYCSLAYLLSATGKVDNLLPFLSETGVKAEEIKKKL